jgi:hypothetical protein
MSRTSSPRRRAQPLDLLQPRPHRPQWSQLPLAAWQAATRLLAALLTEAWELRAGGDRSDRR